MKKKKLLKRIALFIILLLVAIVVLPFLLKDTLIKKYVASINKQYNINVSYQDVNLSLIKHFPSATLTIDNLLITTQKPFEGDTLVFSESVFLDINIKDAFNKKAEKIKLKELTFDNAFVQILVDKQGENNYTIEQNVKNNDIKTTSEAITFAVNQYKLTNSNFVFDDQQSNTYLNLKGINHAGSGDFSSEKSMLTTVSTVNKLTYKQSDIAYLNKVKLTMNAVIAMDLKDNSYTFKKNTASINDLDLSFDGFVTVAKEAVETNITFQSPKATFKSLLSLIPSAYASNFTGVTANGLANVSGFVKGKSSITETPNYQVHIKTENARFKYPDLPKAVENIYFNGALVNTSTQNNAFLKIDKMTFSIDKDVFETSGTISNLTTNPLFDTSFKGTLNLENLTQAYPIKLDTKLTGILKADFKTQADQKAIEANNFKRIKTNGVASLQNFSYYGKDVAKPIHVKNASVNFKNTTTQLTAFDAKTGKSDIKATGNIDNLYGFLFNGKNLKGTFDVQSDNFIVADFLTEDSSLEGNQNTAESLKIPKFLDVTSNMTAKKVVYDTMVMQNVSGTMILKNQQAILKNVKANMLNGIVAFSGLVNTQQSPSVFDLDMNIDGFDIANSFAQLETFQKLIPIANTLKGSFDSNFKIKGKLNSDFSLDINTIEGNALAQLFVKGIDATTNPLFTALASELKFLDVKKLNLDKLKTALTFENGRVVVKPFDLQYKDITMHVTGNHGFDKTLTYDVTMDLPAKYLGNEAVNLLSKLTDTARDTIRIPLKALVNGSVLKPNVHANIKQAMKALVVKVAKYQKDKLLNEATNQVNGAINDVLENNGITVLKDSTSTIPTTGGIVQDSTGVNTTVPTTGDILNNAANTVLDGLLGGKKKKKDSVR